MPFETTNNTSVSIDGESIRRIREEKRLTQLYVAKVVGVTTDTVSRWENNRYPTIRRDNAIKLAEALEVDLEEILKQEASETEVEVAEQETEKSRRSWPLSVALLSLIVLFTVFYFMMQNGTHPVTMDAERFLPNYAAPGNRILVRVHVSTEKPLKGMILREEFPAGWKLVESEPAASGIDNEKGNARWIFRKPQTKLSVAYLLEVPKNASVGDTVSLQGELIANPDGQRTAVDVQSDRKMQIQPFHWADRNGNSIIEDLEILEVSDFAEETGKLHLNWDLIERLWDAGGYKWNAERSAFVPR